MEIKPINNTLKPCPFCGGRAEEHEAMLMVCDWEIHCEDCGATSANYGKHEGGAMKADDNSKPSELNRMEAYEAWNRRV
jgi:Lar family restriction alleviation protein